MGAVTRLKLDFATSPPFFLLKGGLLLTQNLRFALIILKSEHELCDVSLLLLSSDVLATKKTPKCLLI